MSFTVFPRVSVKHWLAHLTRTHQLRNIFWPNHQHVLCHSAGNWSDPHGCCLPSDFSGMQASPHGFPNIYKWTSYVSTCNNLWKNWNCNQNIVAFRYLLCLTMRHANRNIRYTRCLTLWKTHMQVVHYGLGVWTLRYGFFVNGRWMSKKTYHKSLRSILNQYVSHYFYKCSFSYMYISFGMHNKIYTFTSYFEDDTAYDVNSLESVYSSILVNVVR